MTAINVKVTMHLRISCPFMFVLPFQDVVSSVVDVFVAYDCVAGPPGASLRNHGEIVKVSNAVGLGPRANLPAYGFRKVILKKKLAVQVALEFLPVNGNLDRVPLIQSKRRRSLGGSPVCLPGSAVLGPASHIKKERGFFPPPCWTRLLFFLGKPQ